MIGRQLAAALCVPGILLVLQAPSAPDSLAAAAWAASDWSSNAAPQPPAPTAAAACQAVGPGAATVDGSFLRPYVRETRQIVTDGAGTVINARARWRDELREVELRGERLMQRLVTMFRFDGAVYAADTVYFRPTSLAPVSNVEWVAGTLVWRREYSVDGLRVSGQRMEAAQGSGIGGAPDSARRLDVRLAAQAFDFFGGMDATIAAAIPHGVGEHACIRAYMPAGDSVGVLELRVLRKEMVEAGRGRFVEAHVVETNGMNGPLRLWVSKVAPFILRSEEVSFRDGKPWRIYTTTMVD